MMEKQDISCFSAVAPKKVAKTAVLRNKIRRKTYSAIRPLYNKLPKGTQAIFFAKVTFLKATQKEIENDIQAFFVKAGLIR